MRFSVVKVYCNYRFTSYAEPWTKYPVQSRTATASLIEYNSRKFIITNEHVVRGNTDVHITVEGHSKQFAAKVVSENYVCDLALLEITKETETFAQLVQYMPLNLDIPSQSKKLITHGFPTGGQGICATEGTVSRIESGNYIAHGLDLLRIQISAAINSGSSGGIAFTESPSTVIGITSCMMPGAQNIGYIIPSLLIEQFLKQYLRFEKNPYRKSVTFPVLKIQVQTLRQQSLREKYKLNTITSAMDETGVLLISASNIAALRSNDILLSIDKYPIQSNGKITYNNAQISIDAYIAIAKEFGGEVDLTIWRCDDKNPQGAQLNIFVRLNHQYDDMALLPSQPYQQLPYYVHTDGAVFIVPDKYFVYSCDQKHGHSSDTSKRPPTLNYIMTHDKLDSTKQFVFLRTVMEADNTLGVGANSGLVQTINGEKITSLNQLAEILENLEELAEVRLEGDYVIMLSPNNPEKEKNFCAKHAIQQRMSPSVVSYLHHTATHKQQFKEISKEMISFFSVAKNRKGDDISIELSNTENININPTSPMEVCM